MKLADTLRGLLRRWYIVVPGLILAVAVAVAGWLLVKPDYERTSTILLLPGAQSIPEGANPYIFLGGLSQAADVLVRAAGADSIVNAATADYPGVKVEITRDGSTPGPVVLTKVTAPSDASAAAVLSALMDSTAATLNRLQESENIPENNRITIQEVTVDTTSTLQQRTRIIVSVGSALAVTAGALLLASFVDGLMIARRRRRRPDSRADASDDEPESDGDSADAVEDAAGEELDRREAEAERADQRSDEPFETIRVESIDDTDAATDGSDDGMSLFDGATHTAEVPEAKTGGRTKTRPSRRSQ